MKDIKNWYVVYTLPRWEKKVAAHLLQKNIEHYCPLTKVRKKWSDRYKIVLEPLFKGYIFVRPDEGSRWDVKKEPGIINYVYWLGKPAIIREQEIITIKKFLGEFQEVQLTRPNLKSSDEVLINNGVFLDFKGIVLKVDGSKASVLIKNMEVELVAVIKKSDLKKLEVITHGLYRPSDDF